MYICVCMCTYFTDFSYSTQISSTTKKIIVIGLDFKHYDIGLLDINFLEILYYKIRRQKLSYLIAVFNSSFPTYHKNQNHFLPASQISKSCS